MLHVQPYVALTISYTYNLAIALEYKSLSNEVISLRKRSLKCLHNYLKNSSPLKLTFP